MGISKVYEKIIKINNKNTPAKVHIERYDAIKGFVITLILREHETMDTIESNADIETIPYYLEEYKIIDKLTTELEEKMKETYQALSFVFSK